MLVVVSVGLIARVAVSLLLPTEGVWSDEAEYIRGAENVLKGLPFDPTYSRSPFYSYLIAAVYSVLPTSLLTIRLLQVLMWGAIVYCYFDLARRIFDDEKVSLWVVVILALHPYLIFLSAVVLSETLFILLCSMILILFYRCLESGKLSLLFVLGALLGCAYLTRATTILFLPVILGYWLWHNRPNMGRSLLSIAVIVLAFGAVSGHHLKNIRDVNGQWKISGFGTNFLWKLTVMPLYGPIDNVIERPDHLSDEQREFTESYRPAVQPGWTIAEVNQAYKEATTNYVLDNPTEYLGTLVGKFLNNFRLWPRTNTSYSIEKMLVVRAGSAICLGAIYFCFIVGLLSLLKYPYRLLPVLIVVLPSLALFTLYHSRVRYTLSVLPIMTLYAAYGFEIIRHRYLSRSS